MSETMNIYAPRGAKVVFLNQNGYDHDLEYARSCGLVEGHTYTVDRTVVHSWITDVYLQEFPDIPFNSVMFRNAEDDPNWRASGDGDVR